MEDIEEQSFGVVPIVKQDGEWKVLLVHQISYRGPADTFWTLPKGHAEPAEAPVSAALRELAEETGITEVSIIKEAEFTTSYSFVDKNQKVHKSVMYWLGVCSQSETKVTLPHEIAEIAWFTFPQAREKVTHNTAREVLQEAEHYIHKHLL